MFIFWWMIPAFLLVGTVVGIDLDDAAVLDELRQGDQIAEVVETPRVAEHNLVVGDQ